MDVHPNEASIEASIDASTHAPADAPTHARTDAPAHAPADTPADAPTHAPAGAPTPVSADAVLQDFLEQVHAVRLAGRSLAADLTAAQFNWRPDPRRWSVGQCLEHIVLTARLYPDGIERMIHEARARQASGARPYREGLVARLLVSSMEPPPRLRVRTMRSVQPPAALERDVVMAGFDAVFARFAELIATADGAALAHARMPSPFVRLISLTLGQTIAVNLAHARRHLWQGWQVRRVVMSMSDGGAGGVAGAGGMSNG
jgi:hypothetical protein